MKVQAKRLVTLITEQIVLQEYYRDFESRIRKFGFDSLEQAVETFLGTPELEEFFVEPGKKITAQQIMKDTTHLATLDYIMDKMEKIQAEFEADQQFTEEELQALVDEIEGEPEPTPQEIENSAKEAEGEAGGLKLTKVPEREINGVLLQMGNKGLNADKLRDTIKDVIEKLVTGASMAPAIARKIADQDAPLILKIGDEIAKILDGDFSNLKENKRRKK